jgi:hypothetical protein
VDACNEDPQTIQQIDARNSDARVEKHRCPIVIMTFWTRSTSVMMPTKVKDKLAKMKTDLTLIIQKWEQSRQGDGGIIEE